MRNKEKLYESEVENEKRLDVKKFFELKSIMIYILSILIGTCKLASGATPFGIAFIGAIADVNFPLIAPLVLIAASTGVAFGWTCLAKFLISSIIFIVMKSFIKGDTKTGNAAKILFATAISEVIILLMTETLVYDAVMAAFMSTTTAIFYLIFSEGLPVILDFRNRKIDSHETLMASGILLAVAISTLGDLNLFGLSIRSIICVLIVLMLGWRRGATVGIVSGVSISLILGIMGIADASTVATYAVCGLLSGVFSRFGKIGAIIGFIIGNAVWVFYINASTEIIIPIGEIVVASIVMFFMPKRVTNFIDDLFDMENALEGNSPIGLLVESTILKLKAVSDVAEDMASNVEKKDEESDDKMGGFIKTLNENTCKKCKNYKKCWNENYHSMYETVFNSIEVLRKSNRISSEDIEGSICENKAVLAEGLNFSYEIYKLNKEWQSKVDENKKLVANQLRGVSEAINTVQKEIGVENVFKNNLLGAGYKLEVGMSRTKKKGSNISGDTTEFSRLKNGQIILGLSDGMGSGEKASRSSKKVLELLGKYLNAGLDKKVALELINSYIMLGENKDNYATLDIGVFNPNDANMELIKLGACPTFIRQDGKIEIISSNTLPVGATAKIEVNILNKKLNRDDYVVFVSDGVLEANEDREKWIKDLLESVSSNKPQRIADIILQEAVDGNYGVNNDDMTVIVAKVC